MRLEITWTLCRVRLEDWVDAVNLESVVREGGGIGAETIFIG